MANKQYLKIFKTESDYYSQYDELGDPHVVLIEDSVNSRNIRFFDSLKESKDYFTIVALGEDITVKLTKNDLQYYDNSINNWSILKADEYLNIRAGEKIKMKISNPSHDNGIGTFVVDKPFKVEGNIMSLLYGENFIGKKDLGKYTFSYLFSNCNTLISAAGLILPARNITPYCYSEMFKYCTLLVDAPQSLPATTLKEGCYDAMFFNCTSLKNPPKLPATTLAKNCYFNMFYACINLTKAPELPATTLANSCYCGMFSYCSSLKDINVLAATTLAEDCCYFMFQDCTSLRTTPALPATTLAKRCYYSMFDGCTNLTTAPEVLPATTLADFCYQYMFNGCTNLTTAPELPATTLSQHCYNGMFENCTSLTTAPALPATTLANSCYRRMFYRCNSLTTTPVLPATTLERYCYQYMFENCANLKTVNEIKARTLATECCNYMFSNCTLLTTAPALSALTLASGCYSGMFYACSNLNKSPILLAKELKNSCYDSMFKNCTNLKEITIYAKTFEDNSLSGWVDGITECTIIKDVCTIRSHFPIGSIPPTFTVKEYCEYTPSFINPLKLTVNFITPTNDLYAPPTTNEKYFDTLNINNAYPDTTIYVDIIYVPDDGSNIGERITTAPCVWYQNKRVWAFLDDYGIKKITDCLAFLIVS